MTTFYSALFTLMLVVNGDAGVVPRAPIHTPESGLTKTKRRSKTNSIADNVDKLSKSGMDRKMLIIVLSVLLVVIIICCVVAAVLVNKRRRNSNEDEEREDDDEEREDEDEEREDEDEEREDEDEERGMRRQQRRQKQKREKGKKKKQDAKRQAKPRPSEDDDEERTLVNSARPPMQAVAFPTPYGSSLYPQEENQFSSHSNRASYSSDRRVDAVREDAAPFLNNVGM